MLKNSKGFSLVEALVTVMITFLVAVFVAGMITSFATFTRTDRTLLCLVSALDSALQAKKSDPSISTFQILCDGQNINVSLSGGPPAAPPPYCGEIRADATLRGRSMSMVDIACRF